MNHHTVIKGRQLGINVRSCDLLLTILPLHMRNISTPAPLYPQSSRRSTNSIIIIIIIIIM